MSITPKAARQKGKDLENYVATRLRDKGMDLRATRSHGSGNTNTEKSDIYTSLLVLGQNAGFECKHMTTLSHEAAWKQAKKLESLGREPVLVLKQTHEQYADTRVTIYLETFLELVRLSNLAQGSVQEKQVLPPEDRQFKWSLQQAISALKKLEKHLPQ